MALRGPRPRAGVPSVSSHNQARRGNLEHAGLADSAVLLSMTGEVSERAQAEEHDRLGCARSEDVDKRLDEA